MTSPDMDDEAMKMARRIAAHALCGPEKWKPGVKAGMYEDIMRGLADDEPLVRAALAAIIETRDRCAEIAATVIYEARTGEIDNDLRCVGHILDSRIRSGQQFRKDV